MLNLDTNILLHALIDDLTRQERKILRKNPWCASAIVLWEISKLQAKGRISLDLDSVEFTQFFNQLNILPLTLAICRTSTELDFSSDPADELIAATSVVHRVPLLTRDRKIRASKLVPLAL